MLRIIIQFENIAHSSKNAIEAAACCINLILDGGGYNQEILSSSLRLGLDKFQVIFI